MALKSLLVENYKGFYEAQEIEFAVPDGEKEGSGLTLIVGPNNTGKTTIIESLLMGNGDKKFKESERHEGFRPRIVLKGTDGIVTQYSNITEDSSVIEISGQSHSIQFEVLPSRRYWSHLFSGQTSPASLMHNTRNAEVRNSQEINLGSYLKAILTNPEMLALFNSYLKELIPHFTDWTIDTNDSGQDYVKYKTRNSSHQSNLLGDGVISLFRIVTHLVHGQDSTFIIDEPELSLHPSAQKRLSSLLSNLSKTKQVILCTHSPYFANWNDFINGARFIRLNKHEDKKCTISSLKNDKDYSRFISNNVNEFQKPQLLDIASKEILFSDQILFVEGQEDVGLIRRWFNEQNLKPSFDTFGYGVGGHRNMRAFLEMAKDLNIEKVGALYDGGTESYTQDKTVYLGPQFSLEQLLTEDIRDKENDCIDGCPNKKLKVGIFDVHGVLKDEYKEEFIRIMNSFVGFFQQ